MSVVLKPLAVSGHKSKLAFGFLGKDIKVPVVCMLGRVGVMF